MPDKEGSEDEKTTKGVVKKKQKQMMGEEGYDTYRDNILMRGGDHRSKETKERSYTPSKQPKGQTAAQKAAKGKSALELVKADITKKYGKGAIMDVSKKKANEELDLTKIAEAFGGYVVEANGKSGKKNGKKFDIDDFIAADDPFNVKAQKDAQRDIEQTGGTDTRPNFTRQDTFQKSGKFKQPEKNPLRKKSGKPKPKSQKLADTTIGGPVKIIQRAKKTKFAPTPKQSTASKFTDPQSTKDFLKDIGDEPLGSEGMKTDAEKIIKQGRKAERVPGGVGKKTGSLSKGNLKFSGDKAYRKERQTQITRDANYQQRMQQAYDTGSGAPRFTNIPDAQPLPAAPKKQKEGQPQKFRPRAQKPPEGTYSRVGGQREVIGKVDTKVTGGEYGKLRSGQTADQTKLNQALTGRDAQGNPLTPEQRKELMRQSRGVSSKNQQSQQIKKSQPRKSFNSFRKDSGGKIDISGDDDRFRQDSPGREGESITMRSRKSTFGTDLTDPSKTGKKFQQFATYSQKGQQSMMGAAGGLIAKSAFPASAGAEAGLRMARGDKLGATLSAIQSAGGGLGFAAGVANAIRSMSPTYKPSPETKGTPKVKTSKTSKAKSGKSGAIVPRVKPKKQPMPPGGKEAAMTVGGMALSQVLQNVRKGVENLEIPTIQGGKASVVQAKS